jgi:hypothetical protein
LAAVGEPLAAVAPGDWLVVFRAVITGQEAAKRLAQVN